METIIVRLGSQFDYEQHGYNNSDDRNRYYISRHPLTKKKNLTYYLFKFLSSSKFIFSNRMTNDFCCRCYLDDVKQIIRKSNVSFVFIINEASIRFQNVNLVSFLKRHFVNSKVVYFFPDKVSMYSKWINNFSFSTFVEKFDFIYTYNAIDASTYSISLCPPVLLDFGISPSNFEYDVFFLGKDKGRLKELLYLYDFLTGKGFSCLFIINDVDVDTMVFRSGIVYNKTVSYQQNIDYVKKSKAIINILQPGSDGITLRDKEAIALNKVLITNSEYIKKFDFYTEDKFILIDNLDLEFYKIANFNSKVQWKNKAAYSKESFYDWIIANSTKPKDL